MEIKANRSIEAFLKRCHDNLVHDQKNEFLGMTISKEEEKVVQRQLKQAKFSEFKEDEESWPSLYISSKDFSQRPFPQQVNLSKISTNEFSYTKEILPANELFNVDSIMFDPNGELNDSMKLRALDEPVESICLWQNDQLWMLDAPSEANTIDPCANRAKGNVCTFGLGIGYFIFMANLNPAVTSITVIEKQQSVIDLFKQDIYPQFKMSKPLTIICGDGLDYYNQEFLSQFDYVFVDMWQSSDDGLLMIEACLQQYNGPIAQVDFWIESSCLEIMPTLIYLYISSKVYKKRPAIDYQYKALYKKVETFLNQDSQIITTVAACKQIMYSRQLHRDILASK